MIRDVAGQKLVEQRLIFNNLSLNTGLKYSIQPDLKLSLNVFHTERAPDIAEMFSDGLHHSLATIEYGNPFLKSETTQKFVINVEKSRYVKEKSKIPIRVSWEGGVEQYSGLLEVGLAGEYVRKPSNGWYEAVNPETGELLSGKVREADTLQEEFWLPLFDNTNLKEFIKKQYTIGHKEQVSMEDIVDGDQPE